VRDTNRRRDCTLPDDALLTDDPREVLARRPDVLIELLGGLEPARTLVSGALASGIPVVTANKSLLAAHGDELFDLAATTGTPLRYEAAVLAGVPFLGAPHQRPHASAVERITAILNGTSNFILSRMRAAKIDCATALRDAQRLGLAEPDPRNDIDGIDAAEKLAVLLRHYGCASVDPRTIERTGIAHLESDDLAWATEFGGVVRPVALADATAGALTAFVGPAFVPSTHALSSIDGVNNAVVLRNAYGSLVFSGPGAGPHATAATVLDDAIEVATGARALPAATVTPLPRLAPQGPITGWFVRIATTAPADAADLADLLGAHGVWLTRISEIDSRSGDARRRLLTLPARRERLEQALRALRAATGCDARAIRAVEAP
jgi:homoserine dehydrogenase